MSRIVFHMAAIFLAIAHSGIPAFAQSKPKATPKPPDTQKQAFRQELKLGRLASEECVFFLASNGWNKPDAKSANKTEGLWAEKSVQEFIQKLNSEVNQAIVQWIENLAHGDEHAPSIASAVPVFLNAVVEHPIAISLNSFTIGDIPQINLSIVIDTESDSERVREAFDKLLAAVPKEGPGSFAGEMIDEAKFYRPQGAQADSPLLPQFGMFKSYFVFAMGTGTVQDVISKIKGTGKAPAWLDATMQQLKVDRPSFAWQFNVDAIWKTFEPIIGMQERSALDAFGLLSVKRIASVTGLDAIASVDRIIIETAGEPKGVLALFPEKPLTAVDLKNIPANPAQVTVIRFDLAECVEKILTFASEIDPNSRQQFDMMSSQGEQFLGVSLKDDLIPAFGNVWSAYLQGAEAGGLIPGLVVAIAVKDEEKLARVQDALVELVEQQLQQLQQFGMPAPFSLVEFTEGSTSGYEIHINGMPIPVAPGWLIAENQFVFALSRQQITDHFKLAKSKTSFADNDTVKEALKRDSKTILIGYRDPKSEIPGLFTLVAMGAPFLTQQLQLQGIDFTLPALPPFSDLESHLAPSTTTLTRLPNGWRCESRGVVPTVSSVTPALAAIFSAGFVTGVRQARVAVQQVQSQNNLRQIALAMHNYHDTHTNFPERVVLDKNGKPGLSWRVKLLPFLDNAPLYNEFHLDEPWDSDHNKELIERMPQVFRSDNGVGNIPVGTNDLEEEGKTRYVVLVGKGTMFEGDQGPKISQITDGTSNTIMAVEANDESAVIWTKPDDLEVDFEDPLAGLDGARPGGFFAVFADGSVRLISELVDVNVLKALFTRSGGEAVQQF